MIWIARRVRSRSAIRLNIILTWILYSVHNKGEYIGKNRKTDKPRGRRMIEQILKTAPCDFCLFATSILQRYVL